LITDSLLRRFLRLFFPFLYIVAKSLRKAVIMILVIIDEFGPLWGVENRDYDLLLHALLKAVIDELCLCAVTFSLL
jgi:hypothetical protein